MPHSAADSQDFEAVYRQLRRHAEVLFRAERADHTLSPTALVHEAWMRLARSGLADDDPLVLRRITARVMRRVLIDHARRIKTEKRGARLRLPIDVEEFGGGSRAIDLLDLDEAMEELAREDARGARALELRVYGGMTLEEVARVFEISISQAKRVADQAAARLRQRLDPDR